MCLRAPGAGAGLTPVAKWISDADGATLEGTRTTLTFEFIRQGDQHLVGLVGPVEFISEDQIIAIIARVLCVVPDDKVMALLESAIKIRTDFGPAPGDTPIGPRH